MRLRLIVRPFGPAVMILSAALLSACSGAANPATPGGGVSAQAVSHGAARATSAHVQSSSRSRAIFGPLQAPGAAAFAIRPDSKSIAYDSILTNAKGQTGSNIASLGFECCSTNEFGDGLVLTQTGRLKSIEVVLSSWACEQGGVYEDNCVSNPKDRFQWPITVNVYSLTGYPSGVPSVGQMLATQTKTFNLPWRPTANHKLCTGPNAGLFIGDVDKQCDYGLSVPINFSMASPLTILPAEVIVTVTYNTSDSGYAPVGHNTQCFAAGNCFYDSLNVSAWGDGALEGQGGNVDPNGVFVNFSNPGFYCSGNPYGQPAGQSLVLDTPCWTGYHPEIKVDTF